MAKRDSLGAYVFHIHRPDLRFSALSTQAYSALFQALDKSTVSDIVFQNPEEFAFSNSNSVINLVLVLEKALFAKNELGCHALLIEVLDKEADVDTYDDICEAIRLALLEQNALMPWCITIAVSSHSIFQESVLLKHHLLPICERENIGLILLSEENNLDPIFLNQAELPRVPKIPLLQSTKLKKERETDNEERLSSKEIAGTFQVLFGHFEIQMNGTRHHVSALVSVKKLAENKVFLRQMQNDATQIMDASNFKVIPFGIPGGGIDELSIGLVEGNVSRLFDSTSQMKALGDSVLLLYDVLNPIYRIENTIRVLGQNGVSKVGILAIAACKDTHEFAEISCKSYITADYMQVLNQHTECRFCRHGVPFTDGEYFDDYALKIGAFHPLTFWELIAQSKDFYEVGHWASNRTSNHYLFRILTEPIFKQHCFGLSIRLRNLLRDRGIVPTWIQKIICTESEESNLLSNSLADVLGLKSEDVIKIPRSFFGSIAGGELDSDLLKYIDSNYGNENLKKQNVIIVDQAAHHFKTLSALRCISGYFDCTTLAFAVFIDRVGSNFSLGEYLHDSHYISLYSWPVSPRRMHECPCTKEKA